jgi:hypothetical protein
MTIPEAICVMTFATLAGFVLSAVLIFGCECSKDDAQDGENVVK